PPPGGLPIPLVLPGLREDAAAVAAERDVLHPAGVSLEDARAAGPQVPDLDRAVRAAGGDLPAVWPEGDGLDEVGVAVEGHHLPAGRDLPELDAPVLAGGGEVAAVGAEGQVEDEAIGGEDRELLGAGGGLPELECTVPPPGRQPAAVRAEGDGVDPAGVAPEVAYLRPGGEVPHRDGPGPGNREELPLGVVGELIDAPGRAGQRHHLPSREGVP